MRILKQQVALVKKELKKNFLRTRTVTFVIVTILLALLSTKHEAESNVHLWLNQSQEINVGENQATEIQSSDDQKSTDQLEMFCKQKGIPCDYWGKWKYVYKVMLNSGVLTIYMIAQASIIIAEEYTSGTIMLLLISPFKRWKILISKMIAISLVSTFFVLVLLVSSIVIGSVNFPSIHNDNYDVIAKDGHYVIVNLISQIILLSSSQLISIIFISMISLMFACIFRKVTVGIIISILIWVSGAISTVLFSNDSWYRFTFFPHLKLDQYLIGNTRILPNNNITFSICILLLYLMAFVGVSIYSFGNKNRMLSD